MFDIDTLPIIPGCYLFKDSKNNILYIGKAKNLKKRVRTYFQRNDLDPKTRALLNHVENIDYVGTDNELEALILENNLIKIHQPKYNIRLKDAKSHSYIRLTDDVFPRLEIVRSKTGKGKYFGPFISASEREYIFDFLKKNFMIRTCKKMPKKACLRYHINLCCAPCIGLIKKENYDKIIENAKLVLSGKTKELLIVLKEEMKFFSDNLKFEYAKEIRNQMNALEKLNERQNMQRKKNYNEDIINYIIKSGRVYLLLFNIYKGTLVNKNDFVFDYNDDFLDEFIIQYYSDNPIPGELIIPVNISDSMISFLQTKKGHNINVNNPKKGEKHQLLKLAKKNIEISFFKDEERIEFLKTKLNLQERPEVIECFDISHLSGTSTVGAMVQFRNGKPDKSNYRRFRIRSVEGVDDTAAIAEIVKRRYLRLKKEDIEFPNLVVIDGGIGQLNFALKELNRLEIKIPIISIAKHFEEIYIPGRLSPLKLSEKDVALKFIQQIRDEAHRFAIKYNRLLRKKELLS